MDVGAKVHSQDILRIFRGIMSLFSGSSFARLTATNARARRFTSLIVFIATLLTATNAYAASAGEVICNVVNQIDSLPPLFGYIGMITGAIFVGRGLIKLKDNAEQGQKSPLMNAIWPMIGGSGLIAISGFTGWMKATLGLGGGAANGLTACNAGAVTGGADPSVWLTNFVGNIKDPLIMTVSILAWIMGGLFLIKGLNKMAKYGTDPRAYSMPNIVVNLVVGSLLLSLGASLNMMLATIFGSTSVTTQNFESWGVFTKFSGDTTAFKASVKAALTFFQVVGAIAFLRGFLIVKNSVEGSGQATMAQGLTHIIGGTLAINIFYVLKILDSTMGTGLL